MDVRVVQAISPLCSSITERATGLALGLTGHLPIQYMCMCVCMQQSAPSEMGHLEIGIGSVHYEGIFQQCKEGH